MAKISFSTANHAVAHLGRNLYSTTPPALAELVANSYDAYATRVDIKIENSYIVIADNGKGMNIDELDQKYCKIGNPKQSEEPINNLLMRKPMGKKGIGKLAAFSIGNKYEVFTKTKGSQYWISFILDYNEMLRNNPYNTEIKLLDRLPNEYADYINFNSGFIVKIFDLRRKFTSISESNLISQLSKRFYLTSNDFSLKIDNEEIELSKNSYYNDLQLVMYFGYKKDEIYAMFDNANIKIEEFLDSGTEISSYIRNKKIKGWIGSVAKPKDLSKDGNGAFVIAYMNNKIADENIFKNKLDARLASQYIVGEIHVDFLDTDNDPITSSRQGLDESNDEVKKFIDNMDKVRKKFISMWDNFRVKDAVNTLPERIKNNENYKEWLNGLTEDEKTINNKLLNLFSAKLNDDSEIWDKEVDAMVTSIANVVNNIGINEINNDINEAQGNTEALFRLMSKFMQKIAKAEQIQTADIINYRLKAIDRLETLMDNPESAEKVFQEHLYDNPWLINPYWNTNNDINFDRIKEKYIKIRDNDADKEKSGRIDILIKVQEERYPIIIELKKNNPKDHARVTYSSLYDQTRKYKKGLKQSLTEPNKNDIRLEDIKAICIVSEFTGTDGSLKIDIDEGEFKKLRDDNTYIYTYAELLDNAKNMYKEFMNVIKKQKIIPNLS
ncbi:ATP-binding protein [Campylobacter concisus]|uniref:ATP-binding protein n=1 Tax=Campylobacter concisus TaxID=199 RepID=UPI0011E72D88|nr:ATP-binding protein [Campylobacter concisus]